MSNREWVHSTMAGSAPLAAQVGTRIYQSTALQEVPATKPYIMYRYLADVPELRGDDSTPVNRQAFMVMVHDLPGSYVRIDEILQILRGLFRDTSDPSADIIRCNWVDDSEDLRDDVMGTILRWSRYRYLYKW